MTFADPYSFGGEYPRALTPHDQPFSMGDGLTLDPGPAMPNLAPMDPETSPSDGPDVPGPYVPLPEEEL